ncbi:WYL domain-containing protein [Paenibacillus cookii]|uniref:WYL domain-containing protein n=1 Tax=Paenibacillus cookii TaxID=157839 RepID=UPI003570E327
MKNGREWDWAVGMFFSLGREARVIGPEKLRADIRQRAEDLRKYYDDQEEGELTHG